MRSGDVDYEQRVGHNPAHIAVHTPLRITPPPVSRVNVLGVGISVLNLDTAAESIAAALDSRTRGYICVTGVHGVSEAQSQPAFRAILNHSLLTTPDGMPMVWMGRLQGHRQMSRVYGPDLMLRVCQLSIERGYTHYLYGGAPGVAEELKSKLIRSMPGLRIVGTFTPPFRPLNTAEESRLLEDVATCRPDCFWVGLSTPKQEQFMASYASRLAATLLFGVGAAFDFHAGRIPQAPLWMQKSGLEWLYRLKCEPRRLWKRYLKNNPLFLLRATAQLTGLKRYPMG
jgi:N-acetylglucosaminyldiphosphoundecaprenol N-acetyl-beta-D-mannosaminyltransferase